MGSSDALKSVSDEELAIELIARRSGSLLQSAGSPRYPGASAYISPRVALAAFSSVPTATRFSTCIRAERVLVG
jgi:hypothetical protein